MARPRVRARHGAARARCRESARVCGRPYRCRGGARCRPAAPRPALCARASLAGAETAGADAHHVLGSLPPTCAHACLSAWMFTCLRVCVCACACVCVCVRACVVGARCGAHGRWSCGGKVKASFASPMTSSEKTSCASGRTSVLVSLNLHLNPEPSSIKPVPSTLHPQSSYLNQQPSTQFVMSPPPPHFSPSPKHARAGWHFKPFSMGTRWTEEPARREVRRPRN